MSQTAEVTVATADGLSGTIDTATWPLDGSRPDVLVRLEDGRGLMIPLDALARQNDGSYRLTLSGTDLQRLEHALEPSDSGRAAVPVVEERLLVNKRTVQTGRVVVNKRVVEEQQAFE